MKIPLLTISSDKYQPYWRPYYILLNKFNQEIFSKKFHLTETLSANEEDIITINTNLPHNPHSWSENVLIALKKIDEPYIVILLEDFFFHTDTNKKLFDFCLKTALDNENVGCVRLAPIPGGDKPSNFTHFKIHSSDQDYRISTQGAIWKTSYLKQLLKIGETPWEFELNASKRSEAFKEDILVISSQEFPFNYSNAVIQGKLTRKAFRFLEDHTISIDKESIAINGLVEEFYWNTKSKYVRSVIDFINHRFLKIKNL